MRRYGRLVGAVPAVVGSAGLPEFIIKLQQYLVVLDHWGIRVVLVLVGIGIITYPQWLPHLEKKLGVENGDWSFWYGWQKHRLEEKRRMRRRRRDAGA